jgi:hypothetical protein
MVMWPVFLPENIRNVSGNGSGILIGYMAGVSRSHSFLLISNTFLIGPRPSWSIGLQNCQDPSIRKIQDEGISYWGQSLMHMKIICVKHIWSALDAQYTRLPLVHALFSHTGAQSMQQSCPLSVKGSFVTFVLPADQMHLTHMVFICSFFPPVSVCPEGYICKPKNAVLEQCTSWVLGQGHPGVPSWCSYQFPWPEGSWVLQCMPCSTY